MELRLWQAPDDLEVHSAMIGRRLLAAAAAVALIVVLGRGSPRPEIALGANAAIAAAEEDTLEAIDRLEAQLAPALDAARTGAAQVVAGEADPAPSLIAAADGLVAAAPSATELENAVAELERARAALRPEAERLPPAPDAGQLESIASQLASTAEAGARFAEIRRGAESVSGSVIDALDAAAAGRLDEADEHLDNEPRGRGCGPRARGGTPWSCRCGSTRPMR